MNDGIGNELSELSEEVNHVDMTERAYAGAHRIGLRRAVLGVAVVVALMGGGVAGAVTLWPTAGTTQPPGDGGVEDCATEDPAAEAGDGAEDPAVEDDGPRAEPQDGEVPPGEGAQDPGAEPGDGDGDPGAEPGADDGPNCDPAEDPTVTEKHEDEPTREKSKD